MVTMDEEKSHKKNYLHAFYAENLHTKCIDWIIVNIRHGRL